MSECHCTVLCRSFHEDEFLETPQRKKSTPQETVSEGPPPPLDANGGGLFTERGVLGGGNVNVNDNSNNEAVDTHVNKSSGVVAVAPGGDNKYLQSA